MKKKYKIGLIVLGVICLIVAACFLIPSKYFLITTISVKVPAGYDWQIEKVSSYTLKDLSVENVMFPIQYSSNRCTTAHDCLGEFGGKSYISLSFLQKAVPVRFSKSNGIFYTSFRYFKIAMKENSKKVLFFTPFGSFTKEMDASVISVEGKPYIPLKLVEWLGYYQYDSLSDAYQFHSNYTSEGVTYLSPGIGDAYFGNTGYYYYPGDDKKLWGFVGTLVGVNDDGAGIYKEFRTGKIYVDYDSKLLRYHEMIDGPIHPE